jgi:exfoliative toxin A/B
LDVLLSRTYDAYGYSVLAFISFVLVLLFTLRIVTDPRGTAKDLENPAVFGVLPTYTMSIMLLSTYADVLGDIALAIWLGAVAASFVMMLFFVKRFVLRFSIEKVFPAWVVIFVGYVVGSVTSPEFGMQELGRILFWLGFTGCLMMLPVAVYRVIVVRRIPAPLVPTVTIIAAPANLCVTGCLAVFASPPEAVLALLAVMGIVCYAAVLVCMPLMLRDTRFYPSYAAFTFPMVISAVSFRRLGVFYGWPQDGLTGIAMEAVTAVAVLIVLYVLIRYAVFLYNAARGPVQARTVT